MENKLQIRRRIVLVVRLGNVQLQANPEFVMLASIFAIDWADVDFIHGDWFTVNFTTKYITLAGLVCSYCSIEVGDVHT